MKVFYAMFNDGEKFGTAIITANSSNEAAGLVVDHFDKDEPLPQLKIYEIPTEKAQVWEINMDERS